MKKNQLYKILNDLKELVNNEETIIIAIDGMSGSGKSTLGRLLNEELNGNLFHIDDFFRPPQIDENNQYSKYGSNINFTKIKNNIIEKILVKEEISYQPFDFKTHTHQDYLTIPFKNINIIEGSYSMHPFLKEYYHYQIFVKTNKCKQIFRILKREGLKKLFKFKKIWIPNENIYHKNLNISKQANIIYKT